MFAIHFNRQRTSGHPVSSSFCFIFTPPALWSALNVFRAKVSQPDPLGFVNLRDLRIMDNHLHHTIAQRTDLLADNVQPSRFFIGTLNKFDFILAHFKSFLI
jgi:hypothetical protein